MIEELARRQLQNTGGRVDVDQGIEAHILFVWDGIKTHFLIFWEVIKTQLSAIDFWDISDFGPGNNRSECGVRCVLFEKGMGQNTENWSTPC